MTGSKNILPAEVNISTNLKTVVEISESSHIIELKFGMNIEWYDHRVEYFNIKENSALNSLSENAIHSLWLPYIIFEVKVILNLGKLSEKSREYIEYGTEGVGISPQQCHLTVP